MSEKILGINVSNRTLNFLQLCGLVVYMIGTAAGAIALTRIERIKLVEHNTAGWFERMDMFGPT